MITKTQFKDAVKKAIICTIMSHPERISDNCINDEDIAAILVRFCEKIFRKVYRDKEESKECIDINEVDEIYVIAFDCLYKDDGITPNYVIYQENMLCLTSINALYDHRIFKWIIHRISSWCNSNDFMSGSEREG